MRRLLPAFTILIALFIACVHPPHSRLNYVEINSRSEERTLPFAIYTPPEWDGTQPLPLVVLLHGSGDDEHILDRFPAVLENIDSWIEAGHIPPFVMAVPRGERGFWHNWYDGSHSYEDYVIKDLVTEMYARYPLLPRREGLHLMGVSMGGAGALYMALHHRTDIASTIVLSAPIFDVDQTMNFLQGQGFGGRIPVEKIFGPPDLERVLTDNPFAQMESEDSLEGMRLFLGAGTKDRRGILESTERLHSHLERNRVPHEFLVYRGRHGWRDWAQIFPVALCLHLKAECKLPVDAFYKVELTQR